MPKDGGTVGCVPIVLTSHLNINQRRELRIIPLHCVSPLVGTWQLSLGNLFLPNSPQLVLLKAVNCCKVLVLHELWGSGFDIYELYTPVHPNWYLSKTQIHLHYGGYPGDTTEGLQEVTYSPGEHPHFIYVYPDEGTCFSQNIHFPPTFLPTETTFSLYCVPRTWWKGWDLYLLLHSRRLLLTGVPLGCLGLHTDPRYL